MLSQIALDLGHQNFLENFLDLFPSLIFQKQNKTTLLEYFNKNYYCGS